MKPKSTEFNFDGLVGFTHNYGGLSTGNLASTSNLGVASYPKRAALQGIRKMRFNQSLGLLQGVLPPHERPNLGFLKSIGFNGNDEEVLVKAAQQEGGHALRLASSAAAMWTANAATMSPSCDTADHKTHFLVANLHEMMHRSLEAGVTFRIFKSIFSDKNYFQVHKALPGGNHFADEGAANHTRLFTEQGCVHLLAWGRSSFRGHHFTRPVKHPARQTLEASTAAARLLQVEKQALLWQQHPAGIDAGAFHTDVMAVGNENVLLYHELAFLDSDALMGELQKRLGESFIVIKATENELPVKDAVAAYPFNSQLVTLPYRRGAGKRMGIVAPKDAQENKAAFSFLERVKSEHDVIEDVYYLDVKESMQNGGGPACLRLRILLSKEEQESIRPRVFLDDKLGDDLVNWIEKNYRDELCAKDLSDVYLWRDALQSLDELTSILKMGSVYDFQRAGS